MTILFLSQTKQCLAAGQVMKSAQNVVMRNLQVLCKHRPILQLEDGVEILVPCWNMPNSGKVFSITHRQASSTLY
jgi:hypothetical protein